jgi:hypothetical protein
VTGVPPSSTVIRLSRLRFPIGAKSLADLRLHLGATYAAFLGAGIVITLDGESVPPVAFDNWAFPPEYEPRQFRSSLTTADGETIKFRAVGGLANQQGSILGEYGVYFYCNDRLIAQAKKTADVGFLAGYAGAAHNAISLVRVLVYLTGPAHCMPWTSNKADISVNHPTFRTIQRWLMNTVAGYAEVCKRLQGEWDTKVFSYSHGAVLELEIDDFDTVRKRFLPKLPAKRVPYEAALREKNRSLLVRKPWAQGAVDADVAVELLQRQRLDQKNRISLIILDSTLEIAYKDFLVYETRAHYTDAQLVQLFKNRHLVESEVKKHLSVPAGVWRKLNYFYGLRCKLIHERSAAGITDAEIEDLRRLTHRILTKLFKVRWAPEAR